MADYSHLTSEFENESLRNNVQLLIEKMNELSEKCTDPLKKVKIFCRI